MFIVNPRVQQSNFNLQQWPQGFTKPKDPTMLNTKRKKRKKKRGLNLTKKLCKGGHQILCMIISTSYHFQNMRYCQKVLIITTAGQDSYGFFLYFSFLHHCASSSQSHWFRH